MKKVHFMNRYRFSLAGDLYLPENYGNKKNSAVVVAGFSGAVKEQASGLSAQELAARGFVSIAFDSSFQSRVLLRGRSGQRSGFLNIMIPI